MNYLFLLLFTLSQAKITEVPSMKEALTTVDKDTLVFFDLDNTVIMPVQTLGGEEWFDHIAKKTSVDNAVKEWNDIQALTESRAVEKDTAELISNIQKLGAKTIGLTGRDYTISALTQKQLQSIGVDFTAASVTPKVITIKGNGLSRHENGVIFVGAKNNKGKVLATFLETLKLQPKKIVFVDNKRHHLEDVEKALQNKKVDYLGCRHGAADQKIAAFNGEIADIQYQHAKKILTDKEAQVLLQASKLENVH
jgi:phosphoserine phosphatase